MGVPPTVADVIVIGLGPSGLMAAACLAQRGHKVLAIEKHQSLYGLPRAGHVDHEILRFLQELGVETMFLEDAFPISSYHWFNAAGDVLLAMDWGGPSASGYNSDYMMYQPVLEDTLVAALEKAGDCVQLLQGHQVTDVQQDAHGVRVVAKGCSWNASTATMDLTGPSVEIRADWLIAADGARSNTRELLGIARDDQGFNEIWLDVDVRVKRPLPEADPYQICDPRRPAFISPLGKRHHRFEWAIRPEEDPSTFSDPSRAWALLAERNVGPDDVEIVRQQVYTFEARVAERWRDGRVLLAGDAAHTMPPFMGQGACSGMRDSVNLAWKLDLILRGTADESLLDSYQAERQPHTQTWIDLSMLTGEVSCTLDEAAAAHRDALLLSGQAPPMPAFPDLTAGVLDSGADGEIAEPVGRLFPQRLVEHDGVTGRFDDIVGRGFVVVGFGIDPAAHLSYASRTVLGRLGGRCNRIDAAAAAGVIVDTSGFYAEWASAQSVVAAIVRPDHYIYAVAREASAIDALIGKLGEAIPQGHGSRSGSTVREAVHA